MVALRYMGARQGLGGGLMNIGKSSAKVLVEGDTQVGFDDVAGVDEAKAELQEIVAFLRDSEHYGRLRGDLVQEDPTCRLEVVVLAGGIIEEAEYAQS